MIEMKIVNHTPADTACRDLRMLLRFNIPKNVLTHILTDQHFMVSDNKLLQDLTDDIKVQI